MVYEFLDTVTGTIVDFSMKMSEYGQFVKDNPHLERHHSAPPALGDPIRLGFRKPDDAFRDKLKDINRAAGRYGKVNTF